MTDRSISESGDQLEHNRSGNYLKTKANVEITQSELTVTDQASTQPKRRKPVLVDRLNPRMQPIVKLRRLKQAEAHAKNESKNSRMQPIVVLRRLKQAEVHAKS